MSNGKFLRAKKPNLFGLLVPLAFLALLLPGCNSDDYDEPNTTDTPATEDAKTGVLIGPDTLKGWIDQDMVGAASFDDKVVILDMSAGDQLIKGSVDMPVTSSLTTTRFEGVADAGMLVATGEQMDEAIQSAGIDEDTTIVFTNTGTPHTAARGYWTFRYWGFPQDRLKILNGGTAAFAEAYPDLMTEESHEAERTDYSVRDLGETNDELRASIGELIQDFDELQKDNSDVFIIDARGEKGGFLGEGTTSGKFGGVVVVDGHPAGGQGIHFTELLNDDNTYKSAAEIEELLKDKGWTSGQKITVYCTSGYLGAGVFTALDAVLDTEVELHDASWSQTGKYSDYATAGGEIPAGNNWAIDGYLDPATTLYNYTDLPNMDLDIETLDLNATQEEDDPFTGNDPDSDDDVNPEANDIEVADADYVGGNSTTSNHDKITEPDLTATDSVLVEKDTLEGWMDDGLVNGDLGQERAVILDATSAEAYEEAHIPGAQLWDISQHVQTRLEGPAPAVNMAVNGTRMNELVQEHSIDEETTIVITTGGHPIFAHRAYFLFRYYGWPKDRIKVLNGHNGAYSSGEMTTEVPEVTDSELTVQDIGNLRADLSLSLPEWMDALRDDRGTPVDVRGDSSSAPSTAGVFDNGGDWVVFEGVPNNGTYFDWTQFFVDYANGDERFEDNETIAGLLEDDAGIDVSDAEVEPIYSYCRTGYLGSTGFFVFDGILGWDAKLYVGSWSQWGKMSDNADKGGELPAGSEWAVENGDYMEEINYNADATYEVEALNPDSDALEIDPLEAPPNQVENEDSDYIEGGSDTTDGDGAPTPTETPEVGC